MENIFFEDVYYKSFSNIDFINKYKKLMDDHNHSLDDILKRMDKSIIKRIFKEIGYDFKISSPGQFYVFYETFKNMSFKISFQITGGIVIIYVYIYINHEYIKVANNNLTFLYRFLLADMNKVTNQPTFTNYEELKTILINILNIYEDFKNEFLRLLKEENLLEEKTQ
jgi:hypothetical protein